MSSAHSHATQGRAGEPLRALPTRPAGRGRRVAEIARYLGAVSLFAVGAIHAQQYYDAYFYVVPTIGTLFLLNFIGAGVVGVVLIAPVRRLGRSIGDLILVLAALGGIGIALGSLVSLLISEYTPFFGFMESGYRLAIVLSLVFDALTTVLLAMFVLIVARAYRRPETSKTNPASRPEIVNRRGAEGARQQRGGSPSRPSTGSRAAMSAGQPDRHRR
jgi:hypothetical protein